MVNNNQKSTEETSSPPNTFSTYAVIGLVVSAFAVLVFVAYTHIKAQNAARILTLNQKQHTIYQSILAETHTGMRLARWHDFIEHAPVSKYTQAARLHAAALKPHEQAAWAHYSEYKYALRANSTETAQARQQYIDSWGTLIRAKQLSPDAQSQSAKTLNFEKEKSIYAQGGAADILTGAPYGRQERPTSYPRPHTQTAFFQPRQSLRIRTARKPHYPRAAKRRGISAEVILSLNIDERGHVVSTRLISVEARRYRGDFVRAAKRAARRSRFHPKVENGAPVRTSNYLRTYTFAAEG